MIADVLLATSWGRIGPRTFQTTTREAAVETAIKWANAQGVDSDILTVTLYATPENQFEDRPDVSFALSRFDAGWAIVETDPPAPDQLTVFPYLGEDVWPYPAIRQNWTANPHAWQEVDEAFYWDMLNSLPPLNMGRGGFQVGECSGHGPRGDFYTGIAQVGERYFAKECYPKEFSKDCLALRAHLKF